MHVFCIKVAIYIVIILHLALISQIIIEDSDVHLLEFWQLCIFSVIDVLLIEGPMFPLSLVKIGQIVHKWQQLFQNQGGGGHLLEVLGN